MSRTQILLLQQALNTLEISDCGRYAAMMVTHEMMEKLGGQEYMLDRFVNFPRSIEGVEVAILMRETGSGDVRISFRSKGRIDVHRIASGFGGGGHHNAAGCSIKGDLQSVRARLFSEVSAGIDLIFNDEGAVK